MDLLADAVPESLAILSAPCPKANQYAVSVLAFIERNVHGSFVGPNARVSVCGTGRTENSSKSTIWWRSEPSYTMVCMGSSHEILSIVKQLRTSVSLKVQKLQDWHQVRSRMQSQ